MHVDSLLSSNDRQDAEIEDIGWAVAEAPASAREGGCFLSEIKRGYVVKLGA